jgi:DNA-binding NarL/FixJ family response regulator
MSLESMPDIVVMEFAMPEAARRIRKSLPGTEIARPAFTGLEIGVNHNATRSEKQVMNRVLVVDDHVVIRRGIQDIVRAWPGWEICGEAGSGEEAVRLTAELKPDMVLMDISMPGMGGLEATRIICTRSPEIKVLLLTLHDSPEWVRTALRAGARGYLLKSDAEDELMRAVNLVFGKGLYVSPHIDAERVQEIINDLGLAGQTNITKPQ